MRPREQGRRVRHPLYENVVPMVRKVSDGVPGNKPSGRTDKQGTCACLGCGGEALARSAAQRRVVSAFSPWEAPPTAPHQEDEAVERRNPHIHLSA